MTLRVLKKAQSALKIAASSATVKSNSVQSAAKLAEQTTSTDVKSQSTRRIFGWGLSKHNTLPVALANSSNAQLSSSSFIPSVGSSTVYDHPIELDFGSVQDIVSISAGVDNSGVVLGNGQCFTWGINSNGQLGHDLSHTSINRPTAIDSSSQINEAGGVSKLVLGDTFSAIIDMGGDLYTFGFGGSALRGMGNLGHGNSEQYYSPKRVESLVRDGCFVKDVSVGKSHTTVVTTEGELLTTGSGTWGRLGNIDSTDQLFLEPVELLARQTVIAIAGGKEFTLALTDDGIIHGKFTINSYITSFILLLLIVVCALGWGRNDKGQLGTGGGIVVDMYSMAEMPTPVEGQLEGRRVTKIAAGDGHAACITETGELFYWGMKIHLEPVLVNSLLHTKCIDVSCGGNYICVTTEEGNLYALGKGKNGVLGVASKSDTWEPVLIEGLVGKKICDIAAGDNHILCMVEDI